MSLESVQADLAVRAPDLAVMVTEDSTATVELAAAVHGVAPGQIAKTLAIRVGDREFLLVTRGDARPRRRTAAHEPPGRRRLPVRPPCPADHLLRRLAENLRRGHPRRRLDPRLRPPAAGPPRRALRQPLGRRLRRAGVVTGMHIIAVNRGRPEHIPGHAALTGICKHPVDAAMIAPLGLEGDAVMDTKNHGGPDQAVYLYGRPDYDVFERELGRELPPGLFGENLTIGGLDSQAIHIGDRFGIGEVLLEATSPRIPCATFAARMGDPHWLKRFFAANRPGVYARVLHPG